MNISIPLTFNSTDVQPFRTAWQEASARVAALDEDVMQRCLQVDLQRVPESLHPQIGQVGRIAQLLSDPLWQPTADARHGLVGALAYFDNADDLIPDEEPHFGLLDDAIVIELALEAHRDEWEAWQSYRAFRSTHHELGPINRRQWRELCAVAARRLQRDESFVEPRYARHGQRTRYRLLDPLPRIDLN